MVITFSVSGGESGPFHRWKLRHGAVKQQTGSQVPSPSLCSFSNVNTYYEQELLFSIVGGGSTDSALLQANKEMLDLLRESLITGFDKAYEDSSALFDNGTLVTTPDDGEKKFIQLKWHDIFDRKHYQMGATIAAYYSSLKPAKEAAMKALFNNGNTMLPD